jgi:hypothetical protein
MWRDRGIAVGIVLGWHALVGFWLLQRLPLDDGGADRALEVVYVTLPPLRVHAPVPPSSRRTPGSRRQSTRRVDEPVGTPAPIAPPTRPGASAGAILAQALEAVRRDTAPEFRSDPFADRPDHLPGEGKGRFRMQSVAPADVVEMVGAFLFYPPGYENDQCPRNRRNIANLLAGGDSARLRLELEYEQRYCRP